MAHFCGFTKLIFLLLMLARIPCNETRPLRRKSQTTSDLIAGNEFLKLFLEHDQLDNDFLNNDYGAGGGSQAEFDRKSIETEQRSGGGRSLRDKGHKRNQAEGQLENSKQVVKLVTSGSKIVFLEDYDENDAILDAEARDIDLKRETFKQKSQHRDITPNLDEFKVVAISVSSSSQRGTTTARNRIATTTTTATTMKTTTAPTTSMATAKHNKSYTTSNTIVPMTPKPPTAATTAVMPTQQTGTKSDSLPGDNFINRSHKSELSIEEVEPLTMTQQQKSHQQYTRHRTFPLSSVPDTLEVLDSENSASTNIHNVLAAPLAQAASARSTSTVTSTYHSSQHNISINHDSNLHVSKMHKTVDDNSGRIEMVGTSSPDQSPQATGTSVGADDQLLPFQTVIYHDTKAGRGPQSRSISYSSISQNVEDLKKWQQSGILAEARRNVSESLKPLPRSTESPSNHQSEPAKFYSHPSKMYSEPSKFYSEPSKVYSEPSKVYGEPEKFYSEPAKVYGQPSKVYSEPSKVYSQPSKVYSEPAKTYWPLLPEITTTPTSSSFITTTITPPTNSPQITTILPPANNVYQSSRRPAIVSRIAFGENHSTTTTTTTPPAPPPPPNATTSKTYGSHIHHNHSRTYGNNRYHPSTYSSSSASADRVNNENSSSSTPSRRIIFNLDRLPYDLLNAPEQTLLEPQQSKRPQQTLTYQQEQQQHHHINPCLESAVTSLFSSSTLSAHPALQKQRQQQHSSLSDQQHSNQNANGLPNGDLVKCVAEISHTSSSSSASAAAASNDENDDSINTGEVESFTTEHSNMEEQNYKIEESVSAMTNGRAHNGVHTDDGGKNSLALPTTSPIHQQQHHGFKPMRQRTRTHFATNTKNPIEIANGVGGNNGGVHGGHHFSQSSYNTNANANVQNNNNNNRNTNVANTNPDYNSYDDGNNEDGNEGNDYDGSSKNNDYENDDEDTNKNIHRQSNTADGRGSIPGNNGDDDDSKVAYVVEGRNYRKYRVEEKTDDGFIVGEYGVVDHNDGNLRGVRYTADSTINRSLIQKALLTFLKLK